MKILVTGCAGFIGSTLLDKLLDEGFNVVGIDNFNAYYNPKVKENNIKLAKRSKKFKLYREDILNFDALSKIFEKEKPNVVVHLAARAGVRPSIIQPELYVNVNVLGSVNLLKLSSKNNVSKFIFGSSSSVYGESLLFPYSENDPCDKVISPYGASKRSAELFTKSFWQNHGIKTIILRFFTVYGPKGRPDMAPAIFTKSIIGGEKIKQFGDGNTSRDYTFIEDISEGVLLAIKSNLDFEIINLGNNNPVSLKDFIKTIEKVTNKKALIETVPLQIGDVRKTWANISKAKNLLGWQPKAKIEDGLKLYVDWLRINESFY